MTSEKRKAQLQVIREKLNNPNLSLLEVEKLSNEILAIYTNNPVRSLEEITKEEFFLGDEVGSKIYKKYSEFIDQWNKGEKSPDEKELKFLEKVCQLIPTMFAQERQREETLNQLKHLNEDDKQKFIASSKKNQETLKKYQPILKQLIEQERERERERFNWIFNGNGRTNFYPNY